MTNFVRRPVALAVSAGCRPALPTGRQAQAALATILAFVGTASSGGSVVFVAPAFRFGPAAVSAPELAEIRAKLRVFIG
ncbi:MAG TPA: hypothetical protein VJR03_02160 [Nitrospira sp.]|nr:hypothetical protein [Nitrospira sp.]